MPKHAKRSFFSLAAMLPLIATISAVTQATAQKKPHRAAAYGQMPLHFEANVGQAEVAAKFIARGPGYRILLEPAAATIQLHHSMAEAKRPGIAIPERVEAIRLTMVGANPNSSIFAQQPSSTYVNYMIGPNHKDWRLGVPTSLQAHTASLYPGIDVVYYGNQHALEYDFIVAPGADVARIRMALTGATASVANDGSLRLQTAKPVNAEDLRFGKPILYQTVDGRHVPVEGSFTVAANGEVGFKTGAYDHARELVIDPIISYASYFGGTGEDEINASALNSNGQLYAVGQTYSAALPGTAGEFETGSAANNNGHDAFVTKFSADGSSILWTTYLSGAGDDFATGIAVSSSDQPYIVGYTASCGDGGLSYATAGEFPFVGGVQSLCNPDVRGFNNYESNGAGYDAFLVKLSSDGKTELYGTPLGGSANDIADSVALDSTGKVYIVGETSSTAYFLSSNLSRASDVPSYPINNHGTAAIGTANYPTTPSAFYTNTTESKLYSATCQNNSCPGAPDGSISGPQDEQAFLTVLSADLSTIVYSSLLGGPVLGNSGNGTSATNGIAVAVNANGIAYIGGNTSSAHWPVTAGAIASTCANAGNPNSTCNLTGWLAAFDSTKSGSTSLLFNTYVNGKTAGTSSTGTSLYPGSDVFGLAADSTGNVVVTGDTNAVDFPTTSGTLQPACFKFNDGNGNTNVCESESFLTKVSPAGAIQWSTYLGATQQDISAGAGRGVAVDSSNNVYLLATASSNYLPTKNAISATPGGGPDYYVAELNPTATTLLMGTYMGIGGGFTPNNNSLAIDGNATVYFSGSQGVNPYGGTHLPVTANAADKTIQGTDGFVVKLITQQQPSATVLTVSPTGTITPSQTVTLTATVTTPSTLTGTLLPTGMVTFYNNISTLIGTATINASGVATYTGTLAAGSYSITASYPGDPAFSASLSTSTPLTVSSSSTTTMLTVAPATSTYGTTEVLTATVKSGTAAATSGTVTFAAGNLTFGTANLNASGIATLSVTPAAGVYTVVASYAGTYDQTTNPTGYGASASGGTTLTVTKASSTTVLTSSAAQAGTGVSFTLTATLPVAATGSVTFYNGTMSLGMANVSNGVATLSTSIPAAGSYTLTAVYSGNTNFTGSTSAVLTQVVAMPTFTVSASPSSLTIVRGSTGTTTLTLTPAGGFTGIVTLSCGTLPSKATCAFNPTTITLGASAVMDMLTIGTGSLSASLAAPRFFNSDRHGIIYSASLMGFPASMLALCALFRRRKLTAPALRASLLSLIFILTLGVLSGCGGSSSTGANNATPAGTYAVSLTLTSGTTTQSVPLTVVVQ